MSWLKTSRYWSRARAAVSRWLCRRQSRAGTTTGSARAQGELPTKRKSKSLSFCVCNSIVSFSWGEERKPERGRNAVSSWIKGRNFFNLRKIMTIWTNTISVNYRRSFAWQKCVWLDDLKWLIYLFIELFVSNNKLNKEFRYNDGNEDSNWRW